MDKTLCRECPAVAGCHLGSRISPMGWTIGVAAGLAMWGMLWNALSMLA